MFVLTRDPLGWEGDRGFAWATATGDGDSCEVVLYVMLDDAMRDTREHGESIASVLGSLASSVLAVGGAHHELLVSGAYPQLAFAGEMPGLLSAVQSSTVHGTPVIELVTGGWEPIGLGADRSGCDSGSRAGPLRAGRSRSFCNAA